MRRDFSVTVREQGIRRPAQDDKSEHTTASRIEKTSMSPPEGRHKRNRSNLSSSQQQMAASNTGTGSSDAVTAGDDNTAQQGLPDLQARQDEIALPAASAADPAAVNVNMDKEFLRVGAFGPFQKRYIFFASFLWMLGGAEVMQHAFAVLKPKTIGGTRRVYALHKDEAEYAQKQRAFVKQEREKAGGR